MNNKININPSSTKWLEKDDRVVADYFCDLGFRSLKQILDMRVFDLMNMQGLNAVRVEEVIICLYKWLNPNTAIDEAIYNGMMLRPFHYTSWRKVHKDLSAIKVSDLVLTPNINMRAIQHFYDAIRKAFFKSGEYNWRWYKFRNRSEYPIKSSLAPEGPAIAFSFKEHGGIVWHGKYDLNTAELMDSITVKTTKRERARAKLVQLLEHEDRPAKEVYSGLADIGVGSRTVEKAKKELQVTTYRSGGSWYWSLPKPK